MWYYLINICVDYISLVQASMNRIRVFKEKFMYALMMTISTVVRQFYVPNPFEALGEGLTIFVREIPILLSPDLLNWLSEPVMHAITFLVVGIYYDRGSAPALGSLLYLLFYCLHIWIIWLMSLAGFAIWVVVLISVAYIGCHVGLQKLRYV